jgi:hypothetical protein
LISWANRRIVFERERCSDKVLVAGLAFEPARYARSLLSVLALKRQLRWLAALPGAAATAGEETFTTTFTTASSG